MESKNPPAKPTSVHQALASEEPILPSSGFLAAVMERVQDEAAAPAPLAFPWKRALPGFILAAAVFIWATVEFARLIATPAKQSLTAAPQLVLPTHINQTGWLALTLALTLACALAVQKLVTRSSSF